MDVNILIWAVVARTTGIHTWYILIY